MFWICVILTSAKCWRSLKLFEIKKTLFFLWNRLLWCPCFVYLVTGSFAPPLGKSQMSIEVKWPSTNYMERGGSGFVDLYPCISSVSPLPASQTQAVRDIFPPNLFLGVARIPTSPPNLSCAHRTTCRKLICNHNVCKYAPWEPCKRPLYQHPNALAVNFPIYKSNSQVYTALSHVCLWHTSPIFADSLLILFLPKILKGSHYNIKL